MIYPEHASQHIEPRKFGSGNMMYHAFSEAIIPVCKENNQLNIGNKVIMVLNEMLFSNNISDFHASVLAVTTILKFNLYENLGIKKEDLEKLLINTKNKILEMENLLKDTKNYYGNISFYEEFSRINKDMPNEGKIL